jgi:RNA polymerase sigma factor (sigma-70 family)
MSAAGRGRAGAVAADRGGRAAPVAAARGGRALSRSRARGRSIGVAPPPFQRFLDAHRDDVWRFLVAAVGRDAADDCFQETFLSALRAYPRLRPDSNLRAWILTIAHRKALDHHRAGARRAVPVGAVPDVPAPEPPPPRDEGDVWARVATLPPKQRAALLLRYAGDLTHAEVAAALGCSEEAARRSTFEGLRTLRLEMTP